MLVLGSCCFLVLCRFLLFTLKEALVSSLPQRTRRQSAPVDGDPEAIEEMMVVKEDEDPVMIFTRYKEKMEKFLKVNPGSRSHIYRKFTFPNYSTEKFGEIFHLKAEQDGFQVDANVAEILAASTSPAQRSNMNAHMVRIISYQGRGKQQITS